MLPIRASTSKNFTAHRSVAISCAWNQTIRPDASTGNIAEQRIPTLFANNLRSHVSLRLQPLVLAVVYRMHRQFDIRNQRTLEGSQVMAFTALQKNRHVHAHHPVDRAVSLPVASVKLVTLQLTRPQGLCRGGLHQSVRVFLFGDHLLQWRAPVYYVCLPVIGQKRPLD